MNGGKTVISSSFKKFLHFTHLYSVFVKIFNFIFGYRGVNFFRKYKRDRFIRLAHASEVMTNTTVLAQFVSSLRPIQTNFDLIRVGSKADGGYLIPNDCDSIDYVFSPGVASTASFEEFF